MMRARSPWILVLGFLFCVQNCWGARIHQLDQEHWIERAGAFLTLNEPALRYIVFTAILLGICCGVMGVFLIVRRQALLADALAHAVLPGVALGFLWNTRKEAEAIFIGAVAVGLIGVWVMQTLRTHSQHKEDAILGFILASFFGLGICWLSMIRGAAIGQSAGLEGYLFGQIAAVGKEDIALLSGVTLIVLIMIGLFYKEYVAMSFDSSFVQSIGMPVRFLNGTLMLLLSFAIVASLQAVGVVLITALLVIPGATARLLSDRIGVMMILAATLGVLSGWIGAWGSYVGSGLPTGPLMVLVAATGFLMALLFAPPDGWMVRIWRHYRRQERVASENLLKTIYHALEKEDFERDAVTLLDLAQQRQEPLEQTRARLLEAVKRGWISLGGDVVAFTPKGWQRACEIVRNHRLWELYLTSATSIAADHVHEDAETVEHVLKEDVVRAIEKRLNYARRDPHGKLIPGIEDIRRGAPQARQEALHRRETKDK